jgi:hypothetical protein
LLATALATVANSAVPVHAAPPAAPVVTAAPQPLKPSKHKSKKHSKNHKKHGKKKKPKSIEDMIEKEFGKYADEALRIAFCESRFDTNDVSSAGAVGVFQIRSVDHGWRVKKVKDGKNLFDPWTNVRVARHIFDHQGWRPWVCARIVGLPSGGHRRRSTSTVSTWSPNEGGRRPRAPRQPGDGTMSTWQ